jgi:hypothetical protein
VTPLTPHRLARISLTLQALFTTSSKLLIERSSSCPSRSSSRSRRGTTASLLHRQP